MDHIKKEGGEELFEAQAHIWNHIFCFINSMSLQCAIQLGIPDIINNHHQPITLPEMVTKLAIPKAKMPCLFRLMRLLIHSGFFAIQKVSEYQQEEGYVLTPSSRLLLKDNIMTQSPFLQAMLDPTLMKPWHFLSAWFHGNGSTPFETANGRTIWDYAGQNIEFNNLFNEAMASDTLSVTSVVVTQCKGVFEGLGSLVDVGGGTGTLAKIIAETFHLKCTVLDLPHVVATLKGNDHLTYIAGDMFDSIPHADAVLLKWIMHDWDDEKCIKILKRCKEAISREGEGRNSGKVIIIDMVVNDRQEEHKRTETQLVFDVLMMTLYASKERTEKEWEKLFLESGFTYYKITPILGLRSLIEVYP